MTASTTELQPYLQNFDFETLFIEGLGWDYADDTPQNIEVASTIYRLQPVAEKSGFRIYTCQEIAGGSLPSYATRRRIETQVTRSSYEHIIIFVDSEATRQIWQWVKREQGSPPRCREQHYSKGQHGTALLQRFQTFSFDIEDEGWLNIAAVASKVQAAFDVEKVTKSFYKEFEKELRKFEASIIGINNPEDRTWYASLILNRLMFIYFIQKHGYLENDPDYLHKKLRAFTERAREENTSSYFRHFLLQFFHEGLGKPKDQANETLLN